MVTCCKRTWQNKTKAPTVEYGVNYSVDGEQKREWFKTKAERKKRFKEILDQEEQTGGIILNKKFTFSELYEYFMTEHANIPTICKDSTRRSYKSAYDKHLQEMVGDIVGQKFTKRTMTDIVEELTDRDLSPKSINNMIVLIKTIFNFNVSENRIYKNPIADYKKLKIYRNNVRALNEQEIKIFLTKAKEIENDTLSLKDAHDMLATYILSGLRRGELIALEWSRVDFVNRQIYINQSEYRGKVTTPKTPNSVRHVDMCDDLYNILWARYQKHKSNRLVFPAPEGGMWRGDNVLHRVFEPVRAKLDIAPFRLHDLRHTFVSILIDKGENPKYISQQVGHSSVKVTLDIYCHLFERAQKREHKLNGILKDVINTVDKLKMQVENLEKTLQELPEISDEMYRTYKAFKAEYEIWQLRLDREKAKHREYGNLKLVVG